MRITRSLSYAFGATLCALALASCSGGGSQATPTIRNLNGAKPTESVTFSIKIPAATSGLRPAYISAGTASAVVQLGGATSGTVIPCSASTKTCSGPVQAPVGSDTFNVFLYDKPQASGVTQCTPGGTGATACAGNVLSQGSLTQTIVAGQSNTVNVAFGGVIASIEVTLNPNGVTIGTASKSTVNVVAFDADNFRIIGSNPYSEPITVTNSDTSGATALSPTTATAPTTAITLSYNGSNTFSSATISATASGVTKIRPDTLTAEAAPLAGPTADPSGDYGPPAVATALDFPVQKGYNGSGQTVAIIMDAYPASSDLNTFFSYFQIPTTSRTITMKNVGSGPSSSSNDAGEATLDVETIGALAPGANIIVYGIQSLDESSLNEALNQIISDGKATVVNYSAAGCEAAQGANGISTTSTLLAQLASAGIAFVVASGDEGNACFDGGSSYIFGVNYPASDANAIGVGGTQTNPPSVLTSAAAWNNDPCRVTTVPQCATGGGVSELVSLPSYQQGLAGEASSTDRNVPDVAMPAQNGALFLSGTWHFADGTSWGTDMFSALTAEVNQYCNTSNRYVPVDVPYLVFANQTSASPAFIDVTSGNNQYQGDTPFYSAGSGYDNVSGLGVPNGMNYANTICPNRVPMAVVRRGAMAIARTLPSTGTGTARTLDVTPRVRNLVDLGERAPSEPTRIQIAMQNTPNVAASEQQVVSALQAHGFQIVRTFPDHLLVDAVATAGTVASFFQTNVHDVQQGRYGRRYMPTSDVTLPASLGDGVSGVLLDDVVTMAVPQRRF